MTLPGEERDSQITIFLCSLRHDLLTEIHTFFSRLLSFLSSPFFPLLLPPLLSSSSSFPSSLSLPASLFFFSSVLLYWGCHSKVPQTGWLQRRGIYSLKVQGASVKVSVGPCSLWGFHASFVMQMSRQESRSSAGPDHVTLQALITWLIKSRSRDCACTDDVADRALITRLIMH